MLDIRPITAFTDNYHWLLVDTATRQAAVVDPGDAAPVLAYLTQHSLQLVAILITHHHADHIDGIGTLLAKYGPLPVYGPATARIPQVNHAVQEGASLTLLGHSVEVLEVPGHTHEHLAYLSREPLAPGQGRALFCGDTLFAAGCGYMFEGTPPQMHASLQKLAALPPDTLIYCAHEYTLSNLRFAAAVMPHNTALHERQRVEAAKRERGEPTLPSTLALELATNPFLRCADPEVIAAAASVEALPERDPASVFGVLRRWKNRF
ncbi:MAG: hydroxyacylglutathione hydrolase [Pseudomonadales bacterium]|jgi:hydroxyacylglutathione hydrolase|nr:hydroxyacylglutathione hydrolase [Pseudomonadales bacterium]